MKEPHSLNEIFKHSNNHKSINKAGKVFHLELGLILVLAILEMLNL